MRLGIFGALFLKDLQNFRHSLIPALLFGLPVFLLLGLSSQSGDSSLLAWQSAYWIVFFLAVTSLFYRSFEQENRSRNFSHYFSLRTPRLLIFLSQALSQWMATALLSVFFLSLVFIFWSPQDFELRSLWVSLLVGLAISPMGCLIGLLLHWERDFLFGLFFIPLMSPAILAGHELSFAPQVSWLYLLLAQAVAGGFLSALVFEFFFDELIESQ
ncbi:MAG: hypothetical protein EA369_08785 [Bradymonadales bacterium]|nr:MAG: hypothetical protein EA369_08785 [Bradymonadales bacterium]